MKGCFRAVYSFIMSLCLLIALLVGAAQFYLLPRLDRVLADAVRREYLLPPSATVEITRGSLLDTLEGQVDSFYVESREAQIDELPVQELDFVAEGVSFDLPQTLLTQQAELKSLSNGRLSFQVTGPALAKRWAEDLAGAGLSKVEVTLGNDNVDVSGLIDLALMKARVGASGKLATDGLRVKFELAKLRIGDSSLEVAGLNAVFSKLAPVIDLGQFKVGMHIDRLYVKEAALHIQASSRTLDELQRDMKQRKNEGEESEESLLQRASEALMKEIKPEGTSGGDAATNPSAEDASKQESGE